MTDLVILDVRIVLASAPRYISWPDGSPALEQAPQREAWLTFFEPPGTKGGLLGSESRQKSLGIDPWHDPMIVERILQELHIVANNQNPR